MNNLVSVSNVQSGIPEMPNLVKGSASEVNNSINNDFISHPQQYPARNQTPKTLAIPRLVVAKTRCRLQRGKAGSTSVGGVETALRAILRNRHAGPSFNSAAWRGAVFYSYGSISKGIIKGFRNRPMAC